MKVTKNIIAVISVVIVVAVLAQNASALPTSTYDNGKWGGYKTYSDGAGLNVEVVFNVYTATSGEFTWGGAASMPSTDQYIYVYQILNSISGSSIESFNVLNSDKSSVASSLMHATCSQDDGGGGIAPDPSVSATPGVWVFDGIGADKYSWYLIYSSNYAPTAGDCAFNSAESSPPVPIPEPATMALLGIASALYAAKRGRKRQV